MNNVDTVKKTIIDSQVPRKELWKQALESLRPDAVKAFDLFHGMREGLNQEPMTFSLQTHKFVALDASEPLIAESELYIRDADGKYKLSDKGYKSLVLRWDIYQINKIIKHVFPEMEVTEVAQLRDYLLDTSGKRKKTPDIISSIDSLVELLETIVNGEFQKLELGKAKVKQNNSIILSNPNQLLNISEEQLIDFFGSDEVPEDIKFIVLAKGTFFLNRRLKKANDQVQLQDKTITKLDTEIVELKKGFDNKVSEMNLMRQTYENTHEKKDETIKNQQATIENLMPFAEEAKLTQLKNQKLEMLRLLEKIEKIYYMADEQLILDIQAFNKAYSEYERLYKKDKEKFLDVVVITNAKEFPHIRRKIYRLLHDINNVKGLEKANRVMKLFELEIDINDNHGTGISCAGYRPIHYVARAGNIKAIEVLAKNRKINMDARNFGGWTPLFTAIYRLKEEPKKVEQTVKALLAAGAKANLVSKGYTPLTFAMKHLKNHSKPTLELLIQKGANRLAEDGYGNTPLVQAKYYKLDRSIQILFAKK